jgi:radical SAM protein
MAMRDREGVTAGHTALPPEPGHEWVQKMGPVADFSGAPIVVFWEITRACALKCVHCRAVAQPRRHPLELDTAEGFRLLDELASFEPPPIVILTGGDPFMRRDLFDMLAHGIELGLRMSLSPSVTRLLKRDVFVRLKEMGVSRISLSLDGASAGVHDTFRGVKGSFDQTVARIHDALDVGLGIQVNTTVSRQTVKDLPAVAELLRTFSEIAVWDLFFLVPTGRAHQANVTSSQEHEDVFHWLYSVGGSLPFGVKTTLGQHYRRVVLQGALHEGRPLDEVWSRTARSSTNDGKGVCFVSHVGEVYPSGFLPIPSGNVREKSPVEIYQSDPVFRALRDPDMLKGKCGRCPFRAVCGGCRARAYAFTGDYLAPEPCCVFDPDVQGIEDADVAQPVPGTLQQATQDPSS